MEIQEFAKYYYYTDSTTTPQGSTQELPKVIQRLVPISQTLLWILSGLFYLVAPTLKLIWLTQEALLEAAEWCNGSSKNKVTNLREEFVSNKIFWNSHVGPTAMGETLGYLRNKTVSPDSNRWDSCSESNEYLLEDGARRTFNNSRIKSRIFGKSAHAYSVPDLNPSNCSVDRPKSEDILNGVRFSDGGIDVKNVKQVRSSKLKFRKSGATAFHTVEKKVVTLSREQIILALESLQHLVDMGLLQNVINNAQCRSFVVEELQTSR